MDDKQERRNGDLYQVKMDTLKLTQEGMIRRRIIK